MSVWSAKYSANRRLCAGLEAHLGEAHRQASRLVRKESDLGLSIADFGQSAERMGKLEQGALQVRIGAPLSTACILVNLVSAHFNTSTEGLLNGWGALDLSTACISL